MLASASTSGLPLAAEMKARILKQSDYQGGCE
jgi:hypothetical protein